MVKLDIADYIAQKINDMTKAEALGFVDLVLEEMKRNLADGEDILISGFGKFVIRHKKLRTGRNPQTGEPMSIAARIIVTFSPSQRLRELTNRRK